MMEAYLTDKFLTWLKSGDIFLHLEVPLYTLESSLVAELFKETVAGYGYKFLSSRRREDFGFYGIETEHILLYRTLLPPLNQQSTADSSLGLLSDHEGLYFFMGSSTMMSRL